MYNNGFLFSVAIRRRLGDQLREREGHWAAQGTIRTLRPCLVVAAMLHFRCRGASSSGPFATEFNVRSRPGQVKCPGRSWPNHKPGPGPLNSQRTNVAST